MGGLLRENIPTTLDRADLWQPHQVLLRSLGELLRGIAHPRRRVRTLDVNGPLAPAILMLIGGLLWVGLVAAVVSASAVQVHTGVSPATAARSGMLLWGPRLLALALIPVLLVTPILWLPAVMRVAKPKWRQRLRLAAYWWPCLAGWSAWPLALGLLIAPDFMLGLRSLPVAGGFLIGWAATGRYRLPGLYWPLVVAALGATLLDIGRYWLPGTLEPPLSVYW